MSRVRLRDEDIARAAALVCEAMILPDPKDCRYTFSEAFERKMERLIRVEKRHSNGRMFLKRALAIVVATLLGMTTWLAIDTDARAAFTKWIREVYETRIIYRSMGSDETLQLPRYTIEAVPMGYEILFEGERNNHGYEIWENTTNPKKRILFEYSWNSESRLNIVLEPEKYVYEVLNIGEYEAEWYEAKDGGKTNFLIWIDDVRGHVFSIDSDFSKIEVLHMAESVKLVK